jgi:hypothetical protein
VRTHVGVGRLRARLAGMFAARPNGRSPASRSFDGGDGKMTDFFFSETEISARFEILASGSLFNEYDLYQAAT